MITELAVTMLITQQGHHYECDCNITNIKYFAFYQNQCDLASYLIKIDLRISQKSGKSVPGNYQNGSQIAFHRTLLRTL